MRSYLAESASIPLHIDVGSLAESGGDRFKTLFRLTVFVSYILKNLMTDSDGKVLGVAG
jgi:hypothetical protein